MNLPTGPRGKITALGLLFLIIAAVVIAVRPYWNRLATLNDEQETATIQLQKFGRIASRLPELKKRINNASNRKMMHQYTLPGDTPSLAAAELQRILRNVIGKHHGNVSSAKTIQGITEKGFELVPISIQIDISISGLQALLYEIETMQPKLYIDELRIMSNKRPAARALSHNLPSDNSLKVTLLLHGIRTPESR